MGSSLSEMTIPNKMQPFLPPETVPVVLTFRNKDWEMNYYGDHSLKCFDPRWKIFATDNDLKIGDGCVFDLMENSGKILKFMVQILRGDIPDEFLNRVNGESSETPIIID
ncbi:B3 domain-containing protein Os04g0386900-like isoform X2 [Macadamia integrifolia]|uniref:B3 domain-containing protein Os04g0386900-like isoform X2 n=1 Tax=Macadamia integrifolia TaxID=60698 RepID=UPI001C4F53FE|nr:B3 domain-containing protein Os04g0386900-like isoform X2 [Macadamia integrifolia]